MKSKLYCEKKKQMMQSNWDFYTHLFTLIRTYVLLNAFNIQ